MTTPHPPAEPQGRELLLVHFVDCVCDEDVRDPKCQTLRERLAALLTREREVRRQVWEEAYKIAQSFIATIGSQVDTRIIWTTSAAQDIAAALRARAAQEAKGE